MTKARLIACGLGQKQGPDERIKVGALAVTSEHGGVFGWPAGLLRFVVGPLRVTLLPTPKDGFCVLGIAGKSCILYLT